MIVDDEAEVARAFGRLLEGEGIKVEICTDGQQALKRCIEEDFGAVVCDLAMPTVDGFTLIEGIREHKPDLPVVLVSGAPTLDSAMKAVEVGVVRYLKKPVGRNELISSVKQALSISEMMELKRLAVPVVGDASERERRRADELEEAFRQGLEQLWIAYQPIVDAPTARIVGYEALLRSSYEPLRSPLAFLETADRVGRSNELARAVRRAAPVPWLKGDAQSLLFVNVLPSDLLDETLYLETEPLSSVAKSVVLEITERAALDDIPELRERVQRLRQLGFRIAIDDLGAGYSGLTAVATLNPDVIKLDMTLIRDVNREPTKRRLVRSMANVAKELGARVVAEGVETAEERDTLIELECDLLQGYFFGKPARYGSHAA
jgi:EAL domain-containing protein (putative c-di-GMP-specific phosphodiesterase class I)/ActR/RegA family two-component response regulator